MALDKAHFRTLVEQHGPSLYRLAFRLLGDAHDAEEVVQDAFRSAWSSRARFDPKRGERAWLASILRRRAVDRWRRVGRTLPATSGDAVLDYSVEDRDPFDQGYTDQMQAALARLPDDMREALLLVVVGELTHQEAADELGAPLGTILSRVSRARRRLRENLIEIEQAEREEQSERAATLP